MAQDVAPSSNQNGAAAQVQVSDTSSLQNSAAAPSAQDSAIAPSAQDNAAAPSVQDIAAAPEPAKVLPKAGIPHRSFTNISISDIQPTVELKDLEHRAVEKLTQERLEELWNELVEKSKNDDKLYNLLADKKVELKNNNLFTIQVPNIYFDSLLKEYQTQILGFLREATGNESLQYKATVVTEYVEKKAYMPREKFDELLKINPAILSLRKLFPDIDF